MYNVFVIAYPTGSNLEEKIQELLMNHSETLTYNTIVEEDSNLEEEIQELLINNTDTLTYATVIEEVNMTNVSDELFNYLTNGFKIEEATENV